MNKLRMSNLQRMLVCIALLAYGMQSFAFTDGWVMSIPIAIDLGEPAMPDCHMHAMVPNDDSATKTRDVSATVAPVSPNCCVGDLCENSCSMTHCSPVTALVPTIALPWFVRVKSSPYTFESTSLVDYPNSSSRPPIFN